MCVSPSFSTEKTQHGALAIKQLSASGVRPKKFHVSPGRIGRARRCSRGLQSRPARVSGRSALHRAAQQGDAAEVQRLIEAGADVELQDRTDYRQGALETPKGVGCISHQPSHLGHLRKGLQQQVSPTTSRIMRNNPTRPCLSL